MIQLSNVLQQIAKELSMAQQSNNEIIVQQKLAAIKALCELVEQPQSTIATPISSSNILSQEISMMTGSILSEEQPIQDNLLDF